MRRLMTIGTIVLAAAVAAGAQDRDSTVKSRTEVKADDATVLSLTGCLRQATPNGPYLLMGAMAAAGDKVETRTEVKTDADDDDVEVRARTEAKADDAVGTSGATTNYVLVPRGGVSLAPHVGRQVQVSAVTVDPGEFDADVKIEEKATADPDDAPSRTGRSRTEIEIEDLPHGQYAVVLVKALGTPCAARP